MFPCRTGRPWMVLLTLLLSSLAWAQSTQRTPPQNQREIPTTIQGVIQSIATTGVPMGAHLQILAAGQSVDVYLGLKNLGGIDASAFQVGDTIQVTGTLISRPNGLLLRVWSIQDGNRIYRARSVQGRPLNRSRRPQ